MSSQENKLSKKKFNFKVLPKKEVIDTDENENAVDTLDSINEEFERNENPVNNERVNYEDQPDIEEIFYSPGNGNVYTPDIQEIFYTPEDNCDNFEGFLNVKQKGKGSKQYIDRFIRYNMLQNEEDKEEIEVITIDSEIKKVITADSENITIASADPEIIIDSDIEGVDLDFDKDFENFTGFKSKEVINFKDYNDKFTHMFRISKKENSEGEEYSDFSFEEEEIDSFGFLEEFGYDMDNISHLETPTENVEDLDFSDNNNEEVEEEIEEDEDMGGQDMYSDLWNNEDELPHIQVINWDSPDFNVDNMWKNTFYFSKEDGGFRTFRCKKENCSSFIIVFEDEKERQFLYEVKDCKNHEIPYQSQKKP